MKKYLIGGFNLVFSFIVFHYMGAPDWFAAGVGWVTADIAFYHYCEK